MTQAGITTWQTSEMRHSITSQMSRTTQPTIFIGADHGLAIIYFLQSDVLPTLLESGVRVVLLTDETLHEQIQARFGAPELVLESLRMEQAKTYFQSNRQQVQYWLDFIRRAGPSRRMNLEAVDNHIIWTRTEARGMRRALFPAIEALVGVMRRSRRARKLVVDYQKRFTPQLYADLFDKYQPDLVVTSTPGWRIDRYLLREAAARGVKTAAIVLGWDNPSSYALPGAPVEHITCWSEVQKEELVIGSDWDPQRIHIGGIPSYDGYFRRQWLIPRDEYFRLHGLDPQRKLLAYAASFIPYSPNIQNIEALAELVHSGELVEPTQLLVRLHPNHFMEVERYARERKQIFALAEKYPHMHLVKPVPLGGSFGYYSGEDMPEKASMMAHADVFLTVYSTMVVETAIHDTPIVAVVIDSPTGWPGQFTLPLSQIGRWPTHARFRELHAGRIASNREELRQWVNFYLNDPQADADNRRRFIEQECTFTDGSAGRRTGEYLRSLLD